jgi:hypothetical protein
MEDSGDIVPLTSLPESIFLLTRLGESSPGPGTEENDVSTEGTDRCRPPAKFDPNDGDDFIGLDFPLSPPLLRTWILEMT